MHIDSEASLIDHSVELAASLVEFRNEVILIKVVYWEVDRLDLALRIVCAHPGPVNASVSVVYLCLYIEYTCDTSLGHLFDVLLCHGVRPNEDRLITDLLERQVADKVSITLLNMTINKEHFVAVPPL